MAGWLDYWQGGARLDPATLDYVPSDQAFGQTLSLQPGAGQRTPGVHGIPGAPMPRTAPKAAPRLTPVEHDPFVVPPPPALAKLQRTPQFYNDFLSQLGPDWANAPIIGHAGDLVHGAVTKERLGGRAVWMNEDGSHKVGIIAYHGTPHDFDQFDIGKIGIGQGAQTYGHGLYFAEHPDVAGGYQQSVSGTKGRTSTINGAPINYDDPMHAAAAWADSKGGRQQAIAYLKDDARPEVQKIVDVLRSDTPLPKVTPPGHLYTVRINAHPDRFLDWDRPLSEQSPGVRAALGRVAPDTPYDFTWTYRNGQWVLHESGQSLGKNDGGLATITPQRDKGFQVQSDALNQTVPIGKGGVEAAFAGAQQMALDKVGPVKAGLPSGHLTGGDIVRHLENNLENYHEKLAAVGIPGIKYLDQGSRAGGEGTRNYVLFDDKHIDITHKNGVSVTPVDHDPWAK